MRGQSDRWFMALYTASADRQRTISRTLPNVRQSVFSNLAFPIVILQPHIMPKGTITPNQSTSSLFFFHRRSCDRRSLFVQRRPGSTWTKVRLVTAGSSPLQPHWPYPIRNSSNVPSLTNKPSVMDTAVSASSAFTLQAHLPNIRTQPGFLITREANSPSQT